MLTTVLLIAPDPAAAIVASALRSKLPAEVQASSTSRETLTLLHREEFGLVLLDENLAIADPVATEALYTAANIVPVLEINFAICNVERVVREVRAALLRRRKNEEKARAAAAAAFGNELNGSLTGLMLESQLVLRQASPELAGALRQFMALAAEMREQLRT